MRNLKHPMEIDANGELVVLTDLDALRQKTNQRLSLFKASWFLNKERGVPYIQDPFTDLWRSPYNGNSKRIWHNSYHFSRI